MDVQETIKILLDKAAKSEKSDDAMRYAQAALNAAHAAQVESIIEPKKG